MSRRRIAVVLVLGALLAPGAPAAAVRAANITSPLDGRWTASITRAQLLRAGATGALAAKLYGAWTARYADGRFEFRNHRTGKIARGTFTVRGKVVRTAFVSGVGVKSGDVSECTWSIYRDRLTLEPIRGRPSLLCDAGVWTRAG
jgi:hypothetical protein